MARADGPALEQRPGGSPLSWFGSTRAGRRTSVALAVVLALAGIGFLAYPWLTDVYTTEVLQRRLHDDLKAPATRAAYERHQVKEGDGLTRIVIPKLGVDTVVVEGISPAALKAGAGHYPDTPLPGEVGNMAIAGHRTTYGKPFANIDKLEPGDPIYLETPLGGYLYTVSRDPLIIEPTDRSVLAPTDAPTLTLTTCHPKFSAVSRLVVQAELTKAGDVEVPSGV